MKTRFDSIEGLAALATALIWNAAAATHYVSPDSPNPSPTFATWATAARVIQHAVDAAAAGDEVVVTNGVYANGGRAVDGTLTNRVAVTKAVRLLSVNGPAVTLIQGAKAPGGGNGDGRQRGPLDRRGRVFGHAPGLRADRKCSRGWGRSGLEYPRPLHVECQFGRPRWRRGV